MPSQTEIRQSITEQIVAALEAGTIPWRRPWSNDSCAGMPQNATSGRSYSGVNPLILQLAADRLGFASRFWATYKGWQQLGGQVKSRPSHVPPGAWGTKIVFCKPCKKKAKDGEEKGETFFLLKTYTVFNALQVDGDAVDRFQTGQQQLTSDDVGQRFQRADDVIEATEADIRYWGNRAFYQPHGDFIQLPHRSQFGLGEFYETAFHELAHWTEHASRLNWDRTMPENSYALGELIAELSSCYVSGEIGLPIEQSLGNHASYLANWIAQLRGDSRYLFRATAQASKAADYILSFSRQEEPEETPEEAGVA